MTLAPPPGLTPTHEETFCTTSQPHAIFAFPPALRELDVDRIKISGDWQLVQSIHEKEMKLCLAVLLEHIANAAKSTAYTKIYLSPERTPPEDVAPLFDRIIMSFKANFEILMAAGFYLHPEDDPASLDLLMTVHGFCQEQNRILQVQLLADWSTVDIVEYKAELRRGYDTSIPTLVLVGCLTEAGARALGDRRRLTTKTPDTLKKDRERIPLTPAPKSGEAVLPRHPQQDDDVIKVQSDRLQPFHPSSDLKNLPSKLIQASKDEQVRLLRGLHERFWHAGPQDTMRLLKHMILHKDIVNLGIQVSKGCPECRQFAAKLHRPMVKSHLAIAFNQEVLFDYFFLWSEVFLIFMDSAIRWKTGVHVSGRSSAEFLRSFHQNWLRLFGPPDLLLGDQEGCFTSSEVSTFCERLGIGRAFVGKDSFFSKGLVERHIALVKSTMLKLNEAAKRHGLTIDYDNLIQESCMSQNLLLEYNGFNPQAALTGQQAKDMWNLDSTNLQSTAGATERNPDYAEKIIRTRLLAKQCLIQSVIEERLAIATKMKQQKHPLELLLPGMMVDVYRHHPYVRQDQLGWHGPAEVLSVQSLTGAVIVSLQGQPLTVAISSVRRHIAADFFTDCCLSSTPSTTTCNAEIVKTYHSEIWSSAITQNAQAMQSIMDIVEGEPSGITTWLGYRLNDNHQMICLPPGFLLDDNKLIQLGRQLGWHERIGNFSGVIYGTDLRRLHPPRHHKRGILLRWQRQFRSDYSLQEITLKDHITYTGKHHMGWNTLYFYSYHTKETIDDPPLAQPQDIDWDDISSIPPDSEPPGDNSLNDLLIPPQAPDMPPDAPQHPPHAPRDQGQPQPMTAIAPTPHVPQDPPYAPQPPTFNPAPFQPSSDMSNDLSSPEHSMPEPSISDIIMGDQPPDDPGAPQPPGAPGISAPTTPPATQLPQLRQPTSSITSKQTPLQPGPLRIQQHKVPASATVRQPQRSSFPESRQQKPRTTSTSTTPQLPLPAPTPPITTRSKSQKNGLDSPELPTSKHHKGDDPEPADPIGHLPLASDDALTAPSSSSAQCLPRRSSPYERQPLVDKTKIEEDDFPSDPAGPSLPLATPAKQPSASSAFEPSPKMSSADDKPSWNEPELQDSSSGLDDSSRTIEYPDEPSSGTIDYRDKDEDETNLVSFLPLRPTTSPSVTSTSVDRLSLERQFFERVCNGKQLVEDTMSLGTHMHDMLTSLLPEFRAMSAAHFGDTDPYNCEYLVDINTFELFRVDDTTANLTDDELAKYATLVHEADYKELHQFIEHRVFVGVDKSSLPSDCNVVDCVWIRKWKIKPTLVKSRMCARGCFDKQKDMIDRHSSTASRLSQRMVLSLGMVEGFLYGDNIDTESLDISCAFLQGLEYKELQKLGKQLGFEQKQVRSVCILPPENVRRHFRKMNDAPDSLKIPDHERGSKALKALKAMYGFSDAPLMFQLALLQYLEESCGGTRSLFDSNFLYWLEWINNRWEVTLLLTAHVDDLQITGNAQKRSWIHKQLEARFGTLKRQTMPYMHAGIELERLPSGILRLHQDKFCSKLEPADLKDLHGTPEDQLLAPEYVTVFRSLTCGALWACQTNCQELSQVTSLQQKLKQPTYRDLLMINSVIKRLRSPSKDRFGLYFRPLKLPVRVVCVSDASSANKQSSYATEGICILLAEDILVTPETDARDFLKEAQVALTGGSMHLLHCSSTKAKRVSHSTSHAETNACARALPHAQMIALRLCEPEHKGRLWPSSLTPMRLLSCTEDAEPLCNTDAYVDCMDLFELATGQKGVPLDKGQRLGILAIREERRTQRLRRLFHVQTHWMLADHLTKHVGYVSKCLLEFLTSGKWNIAGSLRLRHHFGTAHTSKEEYES